MDSVLTRLIGGIQSGLNCLNATNLEKLKAQDDARRVSHAFQSRRQARVPEAAGCRGPSHEPLATRRIGQDQEPPPFRPLFRPLFGWWEDVSLQLAQRRSTQKRITLL